MLIALVTLPLVGLVGYAKKVTFAPLTTLMILPPALALLDSVKMRVWAVVTFEPTTRNADANELELLLKVMLLKVRLPPM